MSTFTKMCGNVTSHVLIHTLQNARVNNQYLIKSILAFSHKKNVQSRGCEKERVVYLTFGAFVKTRKIRVNPNQSERSSC